MTHQEIKEEIKDLEKEVREYDKSISDELKSIEDNLKWIREDQDRKIKNLVKIAELETELLSREANNCVC